MRGPRTTGRGLAASALAAAMSLVWAGESAPGTVQSDAAALVGVNVSAAPASPLDAAVKGSTAVGGTPGLTPSSDPPGSGEAPSAAVTPASAEAAPAADTPASAEAAPAADTPASAEAAPVADMPASAEAAPPGAAKPPIEAVSVDVPGAADPAAKESGGSAPSAIALPSETPSPETTGALVDASPDPASPDPAAAPLPATPPRASLLPLAQPLWSDLSEAQQHVLAPFESQWNALPSSEKRPWAALALRFPKMKPEERRRVERRIIEWAALTPEQRRVARENYRLAQQRSTERLLADWESYRALTPEQRSALVSADSAPSNTAARHATGPTGLARVAYQPLPRRVQAAVPGRVDPATPPAAAVAPSGVGEPPDARPLGGASPSPSR